MLGIPLPSSAWQLERLWTHSVRSNAIRVLTKLVPSHPCFMALTSVDCSYSGFMVHSSDQVSTVRTESFEPILPPFSRGHDKHPAANHLYPIRLRMLQFPLIDYCLNPMLVSFTKIVRPVHPIERERLRIEGARPVLPRELGL
jgi:hypothetical protein